MEGYMAPIWNKHVAYEVLNWTRSLAKCYTIMSLQFCAVSYHSNIGACIVFMFEFTVNNNDYIACMHDVLLIWTWQNCLSLPKEHSSYSKRWTLACLNPVRISWEKLSPLFLVCSRKHCLFLLLVGLKKMWNSSDENIVARKLTTWVSCIK